MMLDCVEMKTILPRAAAGGEHSEVAVLEGEQGLCFPETELLVSVASPPGPGRNTFKNRDIPGTRQNAPPQLEVYRSMGEIQKDITTLCI